MNTHRPQITKTEKGFFISISILFILFLCFLLFYHINDIHFYDPDGKSCMLKAIFHLYCPGCGGSRAMDAFLHGRFLQSFIIHPFVMYVFVFFLTYYIPSCLYFTGIRKKPINYWFYMYLLYGLLGIVILFFVVRILLLVYGGYDYLGECIQYWQ